MIIYCSSGCCHPIMAIAIVTTIIIILLHSWVSAICLNCSSSDLRQSLTSIDHIYRTLLQHRLSRLIADSTDGNVHFQLDKSIDYDQSKQQSVIERVSPVNVSTVVDSDGRSCVHRLVFERTTDSINERYRPVTGLIELSIELADIIETINIDDDGHHHHHHHGALLHADWSSVFSASVVIYRLPYRLIDSSTIGIRMHSTNCTLSASILKQQIILVLSLLPRRTTRSAAITPRNEHRVVRDCADEWDERFLASNESTSALQLFGCCRRRIRLNFADTPLAGWVKSPRTFDAYYCIGRCARFGAFASDTDGDTDGEGHYATLMNEQAQRLGVRACCAPVAYRPLTVTTRHNSNEETTQTLADFIVTKCGCI